MTVGGGKKQKRDRTALGRESVRPVVGLDLVEVGRFERALARHPRLLERIFTPGEMVYCQGRSRPGLHLAARFAAKEAVGKLLGQGVIVWKDIEILGPGAQERGEAAAREGTPAAPVGAGTAVWQGAPRVLLHGRAAAAAGQQGITGIAVSLSHVESMAAACAVALRCEVGGAVMSQSSCEDGGFEVLGLHSLYERPTVFTPAQIRELDRITIEEIGIPGPVLMERAALGVSSTVQSRYPQRHTLIVCGRGNNGGDGLAAARQLHLAGHPVACVVAAASPDELSADAALNYRAAQKVGVNLRLGSVPDYLWEETEVLVDCLLGTGARGELQGLTAEWAARINACGARGVPIVAVDVPSGVDAATGHVAVGSVVADVTVTFHAAKSGLVCPPGSEACGEVLVWDIGIPQWLEPEPDLRVVTAEDVRLPGRRPDDHKYRAGYVAVLAGSAAYPGAAWLAAQAAYRTGAGYVRLLMNSEAAAGIRGRLVEVVLYDLGPGGYLAEAGAVLAALSDARLGALIVGPGLGRQSATAEAVRRVVLESRVPAVLDADGLVAFAGMAETLRARQGLVLTPHVGELAALLGSSVSELGVSSLLAARRAAAATGQVVLLKGSSTVIAAPRGDTRVVVQGPPQLASAGTGDVLSGIIGALLSKGLEPFEAAYAGAWIHAEAGRFGVEHNPQGVLAGDLLELIPRVVSERLYAQRPSWVES